MAERRFGADINLLGFKLIAAILDPVSSDPTGLGAGQAGRVWFNSTSNKFMYWNGTAAIDVTDRANHTGTQLANTISNFDTQVRTSTLNQMVAPTADLSINTHKLTNVVDGTGAQDAVTKNQLDAALAGVATGQVLKGAVVCAATTNVTLATPGATIDGITMSNPMTILLAGQTSASENGPYVWTGASTPLSRAPNWDVSGEAVLGSYWIVEQGSQADTFALLTNDTAVTLGTTALAFVFRGVAGSAYTAGDGLTDTPANTFNVGAGSGIAVTANAVAVDATVARIVKGVIPTSTSGIFSISGAVVTINHGLNNSGARATLRAYSSPAAGYTANALVEVQDIATDANNIVLTLPLAPGSNAWYVSIIG
jgi:hypothetical protein